MPSEIQQELYDLFRVPLGPPLRGFQIFPSKLRVSSPRELRVGVGGGGEAVHAPTAESPAASYQWLFFHEIDGGVPVGPQTFTFRGPAIPFVGAITEIDVVSSEPGSDWQMRLSLDGRGSMFRTTQPLDVSRGDGYFRPTPPGFWPETEGVVVPLDAPGLVPMLEFSRLASSSPNLIVRVLIVAHPAE